MFPILDLLLLLSTAFVFLAPNLAPNDDLAWSNHHLIMFYKAIVNHFMIWLGIGVLIYAIFMLLRLLKKFINN